MKKKTINIVICVVFGLLITDLLTGKTVVSTISNQIHAIAHKNEKKAAIKQINSDKMGSLTYELIFQSPEKRYFLMTGNSKIPAAERTEYNKLLCYEFRISSNKHNDILKSFNENELTEKLNYLNNQILDDFKLIKDKDTISCVMAHFERNFGVAPYLSIQIAFENRKDFDQQRKLIFYHDQLLNNGDFQFESSN